MALNPVQFLLLLLGIVLNIKPACSILLTNSSAITSTKATFISPATSTKTNTEQPTEHANQTKLATLFQTPPTSFPSLFPIFTFSFFTQFIFRPTESPCTKDTFICETIDVFRTQCPLTDICFPDVYANAEAESNGPFVAKPNLQGSQYPCCEPCKCSDDCGTECCPDKPTRYLNESEIQAKKDDLLECVSSQYRPYETYTEKLNNGEHFEMIAKCPVGYMDAHIIELCLRDYFDFDFRDNFMNLMPVSSNLSLITYKNRHCALCHGEDAADLVIWNALLQCKTPTVIQSVIDIPHVVQTRDDCNIAFAISVSIPIKECVPLIGTCNTTGDWKEFDHNIETACMSYSSNYNGYKNVHCFLCNGNSINDIEYGCWYHNDNRDPSTFVALLDFNNLEDTKEIFDTNVERCPMGERYDYFKNSCRQLVCSMGMLVKEDKCVPVYKSLNTIFQTDFQLTFTLESTQANNEAEPVSPIELSRHIRKHIMNVFPMGYICDIKTFVQLRQDIELTMSDMLHFQRNLINSDFRYITFIISVNIFTSHPSETIEALEELLNIDEDVIGHYQLKSRRFNSSLEADTIGINEERIQKFLQAILNSSISVPDWLFFGFNNGYNQLSDNTGVLPILSTGLSRPTCVSLFHIERVPFCPKVRLLSHEIRIDSLEKKVHITGLDNYFDIDNVTFEDNDISVLVCSYDYFSMVDRHMSMQRERTIVGETEFNPLAILTILCISLSLVSLIVTFVVYCMLVELRTLPGKNNMALTLSLFLSQALTMVNTCFDIKLPWLCSTIGISLHLSLLASAFWMFVCTFHMMTVFVTKNTPSPHSQTGAFVYYVMSVTTMTVLLVVITFTISLFTTEPSDIGYGGKPCYIKDSDMILYTVAVPIGLVVVTNIIMFLCVVIKISRLPDMRANSTVERNNITIFAKLSTITGLTWVFGFIYQFSHIEAFAYIFVFLSASQGIFVMFSFTVNKRVFRIMRKEKRYRKPRDMFKNTSDRMGDKDSSIGDTKSSKLTNSTIL